MLNVAEYVAYDMIALDMAKVTRQTFREKVSQEEVEPAEGLALGRISRLHGRN